MKVQIASKSIWRLSVPIIFAGISETIVDITDAIFLGHYGITELGAIALADAIYEVAIVALAGLVDGVQIVVARRAGQDRPRDVGHTFNQGLHLLALAALASTALIKFASPQLTSFAIESDAVRLAVNSFLHIIAWSAFFQTANFAYSALYVGVSRSWVLVVATFILALTNIGLDYCLIFGHLGFPRLGIEGAALGSLAAEIATFVFLTAYSLIHPAMKTYGLFRFRKWDEHLS